MATVTKTNARKLPDPQFGGVPYGNAAKLHYEFETDSSGIMVDSDQATAVGIADKVILGILPAGMELQGLLAIISGASTATITADIGFEYVDGVASTAVPADPNYFTSALVLSAQARLFANNATVKPVVLPKDAYLTLLNNTAAHAQTCRVDIIVDGVLRGKA